MEMQKIIELSNDYYFIISDGKIYTSEGYASDIKLGEEFFDLTNEIPKEKYVPDNNVGKWIPVSERLPDKEGEYIVTDDAGGMATVSTDEFVYDDKGKLIWLCSQNVTAWMSLPKAYTESEGK